MLTEDVVGVQKSSKIQEADAVQALLLGIVGYDRLCLCGEGSIQGWVECTCGLGLSPFLQYRLESI